MQGYPKLSSLPNPEAFEVYLPGTHQITGYGKQSGYVQTFGYYQGGTDTVLGTFTVNSPGMLLANPISFSPSQGWGLFGDTFDGRFYTEASKNEDGKVHWKLFCVTVQTLEGSKSIGFAAYEDLRGLGDADYNDLVLKIEPNPSAVPLPGALLLLGSGLIRVFSLRRKA